MHGSLRVTLKSKLVHNAKVLKNPSNIFFPKSFSLRHLFPCLIISIKPVGKSEVPVGPSQKSTLELYDENS